MIHGRAVSVCTSNPEIGRMGRGEGGMVGQDFKEKVGTSPNPEVGS